jgi:hypothetical protein
VSGATAWAGGAVGALARPGEAAGSERSRRWIVGLAIVVILLLVFEGALRKWVLPSQGRLLFFVRDPFVLSIYVLALASGWWPRGRALLVAGLAFAAVGLLLAGVQMMGGAAAVGQQLLLGAYGWRNYFLYVPLLFVIGATFRRADVQRVGKLVLLLSVPIAVLVVLQFFAPQGAPINVGIADDASLQFRGLGLGGGRTRPMGPFTSDVGQREFTVVAIAFVIAAWLASPARRALPRWLLLAGTCGALVCLGVGASRGAMLHVGLLLAAAIGSALLMRAGAATLRALLLIPAATAAAYFLYPVIVPEAHEAFTARWQMAAAIESQQFGFGVLGRALYGLVDFAKLIGSAPPLGYGLGFGGNARLLLGIEIDGFEGWAESDWARHVVDLGPLFGPLYIAFRIAVAAWLLTLALRALRSRGDPLPLMLAVYACVQILQGQLTGHGSVHGFAWVFGGLALAAAAAREADGPSAPRGPSPPRFPNLLR